MRKGMVFMLIMMCMLSIMLTGCGSLFLSRAVRAGGKAEADEAPSEEWENQKTEFCESSLASEGTENAPGESIREETSQECGTSSDSVDESGALASVTEAREEITASVGDASLESGGQDTSIDSLEEAFMETQESDGVIAIPEKVMYAQREVNLREGPGTEYKKTGILSEGDKVTLVGVTENGWYCLNTGSFVYGRYLGENPPQTEERQPSQEEQLSGQGTVESVQAEEFVASADDFIGRVNAERTALGLSGLIVDPAMTEYAKKRAKEIAVSFSHDGFAGYSGENIGNFSSGDAGRWYVMFYESEGHRENMLNANYERTGSAVYFNGREYFVVQVFQHFPVGYETQEQIQQAVDDTHGADLHPAGQSDGGMTQSYTSTGEAVSPGDEGYDDLSAAAQALLDEWNSKSGQ